MSDIQKYYLENFNTQLKDGEEKQFQDWLANESSRQKRSVVNDLQDYDLRGAFKAGEGRGPEGHMTDRWKKPNHPTFSDESVYHGTMSPFGIPYQGGHWSEDKPTFTPSTTMLGTTHREDDLRRYMKEIEPDVILQILGATK